MPNPSPAVNPGLDVYPGIDALAEIPRSYWQLVLADRRGNGLGEILQATDRKLKFALNRFPTVSFTARVDDELAPHLVHDDQTLVKAYQTLPDDLPLLKMCGPIINHEKIRNVTGGTIAVLAAGPAWRLSLRRIGRADQGCTLTPAAPAQTGDLARIIIDALNTGDSTSVQCAQWDTGIRTPAGPIAAGSPYGVGPWYYKQALEAFSELAAPLDGFDWRIDACEPEPDALGVKLGELVIASAFGQPRPDAVFEFGAGRANIAEFHELGDANLLCNLGYNLPAGFPGGQTRPVLSSTNAASLRARAMLYEDVISADLTVDAMRQQLLDEHVAIRGTPRITYQITPVPDQGDGSVPKYGVDYELGDLLPFRATERFEIRDSTGAVTGLREVKTIDGWFRVYQVELAIDDAGVESATITILESDQT